MRSGFFVRPSVGRIVNGKVTDGRADAQMKKKDSNSQDSTPKHAIRFFDAIRRTNRVFRDMALTVSSEERKTAMAAKYRASLNWLKHIFGWGGKETKEIRNKSSHYIGLQPVVGGDRLPLHRFQILWFGKVHGSLHAVLSTSLEIGALRTWAASLQSDDAVAAHLNNWQRHHHKSLWKRAARTVYQMKSRKLKAANINEVLNQFAGAFELAVIAPSNIEMEAQGRRFRVIQMALDGKGQNLIALALAAYGSCPLGWLLPATCGEAGEDWAHTDETRHAIALAILCSQTDPGIRWTSTSKDKSICQLQIPNGIAQALGRPAVLLNNQPGEALRHLIGTLAPSDSDPVWVMGASRKRGVGARFVTQGLPTQSSFALLQAGAGLMMRRVVGIKDRHTIGSNGATVGELLSACEMISPDDRQNESLAIISELVAGIEHALRKSQLSRRETESLDALRFALEAGSLPSAGTRQTFRKRFLHESSPRTCADVAGMPIITRILFRAIDMVLCLIQNLRWDEPADAGDAQVSKERDATIIKLEQRARRLSSMQAKGLAKTATHAPLRRILGSIRFFVQRSSAEDSENTSNLDYVAKLTAVLFALIMVAVKKMFGALVLEHRLARFAADACDLTLVSELHSLFRSPADDLPSVPDWIIRHGSPVDEQDEIPILLDPILDAARSDVRLREQVETINNICAAMDDGDNSVVHGLKSPAPFSGTTIVTFCCGFHQRQFCAHFAPRPLLRMCNQWDRGWSNNPVGEWELSSGKNVRRC